VAALVDQLTRKPVVVSSMSIGPTKEESSRPEPEAVLMADTLTDRSFLKTDPSKAEISGIGNIKISK
jgi:hypothetical protein